MSLRQDVNDYWFFIHTGNEPKDGAFSAKKVGTLISRTLQLCKEESATVREVRIFLKCLPDVVEKELQSIYTQTPFIPDSGTLEVLPSESLGTGNSL